MTQGADSTMSAQDSMMASKMRSAVESYAKAHNISNDQATQELATRSTRDSLGIYGDVNAKGSTGLKILGNGVELSGQAGVKAGIDFTDDDMHQASSSSRSSQDARHDVDAKASLDFKEASDYFTSRKVSESGSHTDNNAASRADQLSASLSSAKQSLEQYSTSQARSKEYAEMASRTESMSGQINEDLNQQFAQYVRKQAPHDADTLLTDTASPEVASKRRELAWSFVQEQVQPAVDTAYSSGRSEIGTSMQGISSGGNKEAVMADHQSHRDAIEERTMSSGITDNVKDKVDNMVSVNNQSIGGTHVQITGKSENIENEYNTLKNHHKKEDMTQDNKYTAEVSAQKSLPGADSPEELMKKAEEYQKNYRKD